MRWLGVLVAVSVAPAANAGSASDPAFLGIGMVNATPGCAVDSIMQSSAAEDAGLRIGDVIIAIDGAPTPACDPLRAAITAHMLGDTIRLDLHRGFGRMVVKATLTSRSEVLHRRFVGRALEGVDSEDGSGFDGELRGRTMLIGWFDLPRCAGCAAVFDRLDTRLRARLGEAAPRLLAMASAPADRAAALRKSFTASVPLTITDDNAYTQFVQRDNERVEVMVIDSRGTVRFATPIAPDDDDLDAALDEVIAAAEQAEHTRRR